MIRVHAINDPELDSEQFHVRAEDFEQVLSAHPELAGEIHFTASDGPVGDLAEIAQADVLIGWTFDPGAVAQAENLKWVHVIGAGTDHLEPLDWLPAGVTLTNSSGVHAARASEFVATGLLMLNSLIPMHLEAQAERSWNARYSTVITGKTVVIVGIGAIGGAAAQRAYELGLHVRGVRRSADEGHPFVHEMFGTEQINEALRGADYLVVCAALTPDTRGLIGKEQLELLSAEGGVINTSREPLVDCDALEAMLREGALGGAILDVFEPEPLDPESSLWDCPRLIITPHVSSDPKDYAVSMLKIFCDNLARFSRGSELRNLIRVPS